MEVQILKSRGASLLHLSLDGCEKRKEIEAVTGNGQMQASMSVTEKKINKYLGFVINVFSWTQPRPTESACEFEPHAHSGLKITVPESQKYFKIIKKGGKTWIKWDKKRKALQLCSSSNFNREWSIENYTLYLWCNGFTCWYSFGSIILYLI